MPVIETYFGDHLPKSESPTQIPVKVVKKEEKVAPIVGEQPSAQPEPAAEKATVTEEALSAWAESSSEMQEKKKQSDALEGEIEELQKQIELKTQTQGRDDLQEARRSQIQTEIDNLQRQIDEKEQTIAEINDQIFAAYQKEHPEASIAIPELSPTGKSASTETTGSVETKGDNPALTTISYCIQERRRLLDKLTIFDSLPEKDKRKHASEAESDIRKLESEIAKIWGESKDDIKDKLPAWALADLAEITVSPELKKEAEELTIKAREMEPKELHENVKKLVDQLATDSFDAFKVRKIEEKYGKGWLGKVKAFFGGEYDYKINPDDPDKKTRADNFRVLMRVGRKVLTDRKLLTAGAITAALGILTGGFGAVGIGIATSKTLLGTGAGRLAAEVRAEIAGEEGKAREQLLRGELEHFKEMNDIAIRLNKSEYASDSERNALIKQLVDIYYEADGGGITADMKDSREYLGTTTEKWDKVRNKWTNVGAIAGAGVGIMQNWQWLSDVAHRIDLSGDGVRHATQSVGHGFQHIYGQAFSDQYGALHAAVPGETIGKAGEIGHRLLESNQQVYWAMTKSVAPNLLKTAAVLAGALLPRIETKYQPTQFGLEGEFGKRSHLHEPKPPIPPSGGETPPESPLGGPTSGEPGPSGPDSGGPTPEAAAATETATVALEKLKETLEEEYGLIPGKYIQFKDELTDKSDKEKWVQKDVRYRFAKMNKRGGLVFEEEVGEDEVHEHILSAERFMQLRDDERIALLRKKGEPVKEPEIKSKEEKEEKPAAKPEEEKEEKKVEEPAEKEVKAETDELPVMLDNMGKIRVGGEPLLLSDDKVTPEHLRDRTLTILEGMKDKNKGKKNLVASIEKDIETVNAWIAEKEGAVKKK